MRLAWILAALVVAGCGKERVTRDDCIRATAHELFLEDLADLGDPGFAQALGKDDVTAGPPTLKDAVRLLDAHVAASPLQDERQLEVDRRLDTCVAHSSLAHIDCVFAARTATAVQRCPR